MIRIGFYTGTVYNDSYDKLNDIRECCQQLTPSDPAYANPQKLDELRKKLKERCKDCFGCPESQNGGIV